jgi:hypothetical protein
MGWADCGDDSRLPRDTSSWQLQLATDRIVISANLMDQGAADALIERLKVIKVFLPSPSADASPERETDTGALE